MGCNHLTFHLLWGKRRITLAKAVGTLINEYLKRLLPREEIASSANTPQKRQLWSIGMYVGTSPLAFGPPENSTNPVLDRDDVSDVPALFVADPFMIRQNHTWYMFFEVLNAQTRTGQIGLAISQDGASWQYQQIVLAEPFHLSYPYVFQWEDEYYMVPESCEANSVRLYKAFDFPFEWAFVKTLLEGRKYADPSIFCFRDKVWMFASSGSPPFYADNLCLYYADEPLGPWIEHPGSPVVQADVRAARPAGRVVVVEDRVIRYAQDCYPTYGTQVRAFEITELSTQTYSEREVDESPVLRASGKGWNGSGMHHIDPHCIDQRRWIASVDGWIRIWV